MAIGVSQVGGQQDAVAKFVFGNDTASVKLGGATLAHTGAVSSGAHSAIDRVVASYGSDTASSGGSHALYALRQADSHIGSAGSESYSLSGGVVHDPIFVASHLAAISPIGVQGGSLADSVPHSGAAAHTLINLGENTTISVKNVTPTLGGGHFK
jgi:hypothetical protein